MQESIRRQFTRFSILAFATLCFIQTLVAQDLASQPSFWAAKLDIPAFEKIENDRIAEAQRSIDAIEAVKGPRSVHNTLAPYDDALRLINTARYLADIMQKVHPDAAFRDQATAMLTKSTAAATALSLDRDVYQALASLDLSKADAATRYYVERQLLEFRLAGVNKDDATRARLKQLNDQLTEEQSAFDRNIADDQRTIEVDSTADLDGLPPDYIANHKPGADGKIQITTRYPDLFPVLTFAKNDDVRRRMMTAFLNMAYPKNDEVLLHMMQARYEIASLLGYASWADYNAADKMIGRASHIADFIQRLDDATRPAAQREYKMLLAQKQKLHAGATEIFDYDSWFYKELVRRSQYDFDSQSVRPYLPYEAVKKGVLDSAAKFFRVTFQQEKDAPAWDPAAETWDVIEKGKPIGRFYLDMHPRPGKYTHAEMNPVLDGVRGRQLPEAILICNLPAPTPTDPGLNEIDDVVTFFHEFGHLMHWILGGQQQWSGISGINMEMDFVEAPSQMLEELIRCPQVLSSFAHHYKTGEPIPIELVTRMNRASAYGRANDVRLQTAFSAISLDVYKSQPQNVDLNTVAENDVRRYTLFHLSPETHFLASFGHLGGYSSVYYTYMFDKVIAEDFFAQFDPKDPLIGTAPERYRRLVLEPGGSMSANDLVKNFLGRPQNMDAFERWMEEEFQPVPSPNSTNSTSTKGGFSGAP